MSGSTTRMLSAASVKHLGDDQRHRGVGALAHVDRPHVERDAAVGADVHDGDRGRRRDRGLEADGDAASAPHDAAAPAPAAAAAAAAAVERRRPVHPRRHRLQHLRDRGVAHRRAGRLRAALAQQVAAAELERIDAELARDEVGVALIGPHQLRNAEAAQRAGRRPVGIELVGIDRDIVDVVRTGRGEARFLRHARSDVRIGAAVPPHLAGARGDAAVARDARS